MSLPDPTISLTDLSQTTGESERTLRYWVQFGLLSGPLEKGPAARYPAEHVARVAWIRGRQADGVPLKAILAEVQRAERGVAGRQEPSLSISADQQRVGSTQSQVGQERTAIQEYLARSNLLSQRSGSPLPSQPLNTSAPRPAAGEWNPQRTRWEHVQLDDGVELLIKRPLDTWRQRKVEKLLRYAATLFANQGSTGEPPDTDAVP